MKHLKKESHFKGFKDFKSSNNGVGMGNTKFQGVKMPKYQIP